MCGALTRGGPMIIPLQRVSVISSSSSNPQLTVPSPTPFCPSSSSSNSRKLRGTLMPGADEGRERKITTEIIIFSQHKHACRHDIIYSGPASHTPAHVHVVTLLCMHTHALIFELHADPLIVYKCCCRCLISRNACTRELFLQYMHTNTFSTLMHECSCVISHKTCTQTDTFQNAACKNKNACRKKNLINR